MHLQEVLDCHSFSASTQPEHCFQDRNCSGKEQLQFCEPLQSVVPSIQCEPGCSKSFFNAAVFVYVHVYLIMFTVNVCCPEKAVLKSAIMYNVVAKQIFMHDNQL